MRCPKCHYLSFEPEARCRNCGYDLAISDDDLVIKVPGEHDDSEGPLADFDLRTPAIPAPFAPLAPVAPAATRSSRAPLAPLAPLAPRAPQASQTRPAAPPAPTLGPIHPVSAAEARSGVSVVPAPRAARPPSTTAELPLFMRGLPEAGLEPDTPLVPFPAMPRAPLAVRRRSIDPENDPVRADRSSIPDMAAHIDSVWAPLATPLPVDPSPAEESRTDRVDHVGMLARAAAGTIDLCLLGGINFVVAWLTVRLCAVTLGQVLTLPIVPLVAFFLLVDVGYLFLFTATTGQTLGKMAAGIRVVAQGPDAGLEPLSVRQAIVRSFATVPSVVAFGAGFLPAIGGEGLAVHDRLAHTRVVRA
jgi:uncharacterized RDD family membrane protein YckC